MRKVAREKRHWNHETIHIGRSDRRRLQSILLGVAALTCCALIAFVVQRDWWNMGPEAGSSLPLLLSVSLPDQLDNRRQESEQPQAEQSGPQLKGPSSVQSQSPPISSSRQYTRTNKRGRVVMRKIDKISAVDLRDISDDLLLKKQQPMQPRTDGTRSTQNDNAQLNQSTNIQHDKEPILQLLQEAGITQGIDSATINMLPTWKDILSLYYSKHTSTTSLQDESAEPIVLGRCDPKANADMILGVAGLFNSGTNALTYYLRANLVMPAYRLDKNTSDATWSNNYRNQIDDGGILTQVPWDKHWFSSMRQDHAVDWMQSRVDPHRVLPIVMIRDPYTWFQSMRKAPYLVDFVPETKQNYSKLVLPVRMPKMTGHRTWPTLFHLWNDWYQDYVSSPSPFIMIRVEDLWFRPRQTMTKLMECTGAHWRDASEQFTYVVDASKWEHVRFQGPQSTLVSSIIKHGNRQRRIRDLTSSDLDGAANALSDDLMRQFGYIKAGPGDT